MHMVNQYPKVIVERLRRSAARPDRARLFAQLWDNIYAGDGTQQTRSASLICLRLAHIKLAWRVLA